MSFRDLSRSHFTFAVILGQAFPYRSNAVEKITLEIFAVFHMDAGTFALPTQAAAN